MFKVVNIYQSGLQVRHILEKSSQENESQQEI